MPPRRADYQARPLAERWEAKVERTDDCWEWRGARDAQGYGKVQSGGPRGVSKVLYAHRVAYELHTGPIPAGMTIDHLCRNRGCVRPNHLEAVALTENIRRSDSWTARRSRATQCVNGHEFTPENTYVTTQGHRHCRQCARRRDQARVRHQSSSSS